MTANAQHPPPLVIAFEGIDASGKSTLAAGLVADLQAAGRSARSFRWYGWDFVGDVLGNFDCAGVRTAEAASAAYAFAFETSVQEAALCGVEVAVFDRHKWSAAISDELFGLPGSIIAANLAAVPDPALVFHVGVPPELALARRRAGREPGFWELPGSYAVGAAFLAERARYAAMTSEARGAAFVAQKRDESARFARRLDGLPFGRRLDGTRSPTALRTEVVAAVLAALAARGGS